MQTPKSNDLQIPKQIDRYELQERIGAGGMGTIFKGFDTKLKRKVAIKVISEKVKDPSVKSTIKDRFLNEARAAGGLSHPNLVQIYDFSELDGLAYIVMEFIEGETLDELIKSKGPLNNEELVRIGREIASGLAFAHKKGIVHRDIKPSNIIIEAASGLAKILDFGIAKFVNEEEMKLTSTGMVLGSTHYLSPEHITGKNLDGRSDLFCLGTLLYEAATGVLPFRGQNSSSILYKIVHYEPQDPSEVRSTLHPAVSKVILKLLKKNPMERYQKGEDAEKELSDVYRLLMGDSKSSGGIEVPPVAGKSLFVRDSQLLSALQSQKLISSQQGSQLRGKAVMDILLKEDIVAEDDLSKLVSEILSLPWIPRGRLRSLRVQKDAINSLSAEVIEKFNILPFYRDNARKVISIVIDGSKDFQKDEAIAELLEDYQLQFYVGGRLTIRRLIDAQVRDSEMDEPTLGISDSDSTLAEAFEDKRLLLLDPSPHLQEGLIRLFKGLEGHLVLCNNLEEALQKIKREPFDVILAQRSQVGDELYFEQLLLKQNPACDIRYFDHLAQELFQESLSYRKFKEFFSRMIQVYLNQGAKPIRQLATQYAALGLKLAQEVSTNIRHLDEVYFATMLWKFDRQLNNGNKGLELFDGVFRFRAVADSLNERFDGRGIHGLREDQIPLAARVIMALQPLESYPLGAERSLTDQEINEIRQKYSGYSGKQLDPRIVAGVIQILRPHAASQAKTGRIVIVDSDTQYAQKLSAQLRQIAQNTTVYADGIAALAGIKKDRPDLIISEVILSKLDGFSLCARLRSDESLKEIPIIFLSESNAPEHSTKALQLGADDFLLKSQEPQFIVTKLERILKKTRS